MIQWSNFKFITLYWSPYASQVLADVCTYTCPILRPLTLQLSFGGRVYIHMSYFEAIGTLFWMSPLGFKYTISE